MTGSSTNLLFYFKTVITDRHQDPAPKFNSEKGTVCAQESLIVVCSIYSVYERKL